MQCPRVILASAGQVFLCQILKIHQNVPEFIEYVHTQASLLHKWFQADNDTTKFVNHTTTLLLLLLKPFCCAIHACTSRLRMAKPNMSFAPSTNRFTHYSYVILIHDLALLGAKTVTTYCHQFPQSVTIILFTRFHTIPAIVSQISLALAYSGIRLSLLPKPQCQDTPS